MTDDQMRQGFLERARRLRDEVSALRRDIKEQAPSEAHALLWIARVEEELERLDRAIQATRRYLALVDEEALPVLNHLGHLLSNTGCQARAAVCFRRTSAAEPKGHRWVAYAICLLRLGMRGEAQRALERALECEPDFDEASLNLGWLLLEEEPSKAKQCFQRAADLDPNWPANRSGLADLALHERDYERAVDLAREGLSIDPESRHCHSSLAEALEKLGQFEEAEEHLRKALSNCSGRELQCRAELAQFLQRQGRYDEAKEEFESLLRGWPDEEQPYQDYADFLEQALGRRDEAQRLRGQLQVVSALLAGKPPRDESL
jgi:tetratricopeptide (TPR) repeat protein